MASKSVTKPVVPCHSKPLIVLIKNIKQTFIVIRLHSRLNLQVHLQQDTLRRIQDSKKYREYQHFLSDYVYTYYAKLFLSVIYNLICHTE